MTRGTVCEVPAGTKLPVFSISTIFSIVDHSAHVSKDKGTGKVQYMSMGSIPDLTSRSITPTYPILSLHPFQQSHQIAMPNDSSTQGDEVPLMVPIQTFKPRKY